MWPLLTMFSPSTLRIVLIGASLLAAFAAGWTVQGWRWDASSARTSEELVRSMERLQQEKQRIELENRALVAAAQQKDAKYADLFRRYKNEVNEATDGGRCYGPAAVELFNRAVASVSGGAAGSAGVSDGTTVAATDRDVLDNQLALLEQYNKCRNQVLNIIEWDNKTFKKK